MKKLSRNDKIRAAVIFAFVLVCAAVLLRQPVNRWLDNRDRLTINNHMAQLQFRIQHSQTAADNPNNSYPPVDEVREMVNDSNFINPHTKKPYTFVDPPYAGTLLDGEITYGHGHCDSRSGPIKRPAYFEYVLVMPRTNEKQTICLNLNKGSQADAEINYRLSCKPRWFGIKETCDQTILDHIAQEQQRTREFLDSLSE